jgi:hypothetical protein
VEAHFVLKWMSKTKPRHGDQTLSANRRASAVSPSGKTRFNRWRMIGSAEKRVSAASGYHVSTGSEVGSFGRLRERERR